MLRALHRRSSKRESFRHMLSEKFIGEDATSIKVTLTVVSQLQEDGIQCCGWRHYGCELLGEGILSLGRGRLGTGVGTYLSQTSFLYLFVVFIRM